jgi:hypothetical protein
MEIEISSEERERERDVERDRYGVTAKREFNRYDSGH